eukprot:6437605-Pyramimonas_sp.AAC.2
MNGRPDPQQLPQETIEHVAALLVGLQHGLTPPKHANSRSVALPPKTVTTERPITLRPTLHRARTRIRGGSDAHWGAAARNWPALRLLEVLAQAGQSTLAGCPLSQPWIIDCHWYGMLEAHHYRAPRVP